MVVPTREKRCLLAPQSAGWNRTNRLAAPGAPIDRIRRRQGSPKKPARLPTFFALISHKGTYCRRPRSRKSADFGPQVASAERDNLQGAARPTFLTLPHRVASGKSGQALA